VSKGPVLASHQGVAVAAKGLLGFFFVNFNPVFFPIPAFTESCVRNKEHSFFFEKK
jgi:hypothetical protein